MRTSVKGDCDGPAFSGDEVCEADGRAHGDQGAPRRHQGRRTQPVLQRHRQRSGARRWPLEHTNTDRRSSRARDTDTRLSPRAQGRHGGDDALLQRETTHPSSLNVSYGLCHGCAVDKGGEPISNLSSYSKQLSTPGAESVRHCGSALAHACRQVFSVLKAADVLSEETLAQGAFGAVQVRVYEGDNNAFTAPHSDTVVGVDKEGNLLAEIDHVRACPIRHDLCPQPSTHTRVAAATCASSPPHTRARPLSADP